MAAKPSGQSGHSIAFCTSEEILGQVSVTGFLKLAPESGNPVPRWNASNVAVRQRPAGNIKPDKERSRERIDGMSAIVNALGRALLPDNSRFICGDGRTMLLLE
jgi:hypothetical protein